MVGTRPMRRPPLRSCVACHTGREQRALLRVVRTPAGGVHFDASGRANGRGAYVCRDLECITTATRRGALARALAASIPAELASELAAVLGPTGMTLGGSIGPE